VKTLNFYSQRNLDTGPIDQFSCRVLKGEDSVNEYETLFHEHVDPFLSDSEKIECIGHIDSGFRDARHFIVGVTNLRIVFVEVESDRKGPKPIFKEVRQIPFESVAWLTTTKGFIRIELHSGDVYKYNLNARSKSVPGQKEFIKAMKRLYFQFEEDAYEMPEKPSERTSLETTTIEKMPIQQEAKQNFGPGILVGTIAAGIGAVIWAAITYFVEYRFSYMAVGVGLLVGEAMQINSRGTTGRSYGAIAAVLSFAGCVLGNILAIVTLAADIWEVTWLEALKATYYLPEMLKEIMIDNIDFIDIFLYAVAMYIGYKIAYTPGRKKKEEASPSVYS
jgi:hypothetical protein